MGNRVEKKKQKRKRMKVMQVIHALDPDSDLCSCLCMIIEIN